jgi:tetratricopeptide (TPR) repeat protein
LLAACSKDVVALIAPHYTPAEVKLARQFYGAGMADLRRGNALAKQGDWAGATIAWEAARQANPGNHAALHNLALAAEARQDFPTALKSLDKALATYPAGLYHETQKRLKSEQTLYLAAARQVDARRTAPSLARQQVPAVTSPQALPASHEVPASFDMPVRLPPAE